MSKNNDDKNLTNKVIDLVLSFNIKESEFHLELLNIQVKRYQAEIRFLENTKPFFFQKKKLQEYQLQLEECENNLFETYKKISNEVELIHKIQESISTK